ncbi:hypothetical protein Pgy4_33111 [Pseudomonas savastanoi pv. glycinea str. race 4]|uniref:Uncharacterized protein n=1 Tax=Pseudomonas savastanoi pv. glycinea str. race 4 TaxID=875330 RepID=F3CEV6_PSESG|nr:hypothetical protein Pgy4_33111 [Pseudomonas savastanoi pv. glycinea str. race 4]
MLLDRCSQIGVGLVELNERGRQAFDEAVKSFDLFRHDVTESRVAAAPI